MEQDEQKWQITDEEKLLSQLGEAPHVAFIDMYYKGVHVSRTFRHFNPAVVDRDVQKYIDKRLAQGWLPSWNKQTNEELSGEAKPKEELGNCPHCGAPNKLSKNGKKYCSALCWTKE